MEVEDLMQYMLNLFNKTSNDLHAEYEKLSQKDMELSDLDHYIEFHTLKSYELAKIGRLRKTLREERREIKNNIEMIEVIKKFTDKYNNKLITGDIIQNLKEQGTFRIVKEYQSIRQAERETGIHNESISMVCNNKQKTAGNFVWKFKEECI